MATFNSITKYRKVWKNRIKELRKQKNLSEKDASEFMVKTARSLAPRKTGATIKGIRMRKGKNSWTVESWVPGLFKQNLFANQTAPYRTLHFEKPNRFYTSPQTVVYGSGAVSPSGNSIMWTGLPRFFHFATLRTREKFKDIVKKNTNKALRVSIG